jgi:DNA-binding protein HU-beta
MPSGTAQAVFCLLYQTFCLVFYVIKRREEKKMNKKELVDAMAEAADINKAAAEKALNSLLLSITETLAQGDKVTLIGFGTFSVAERAARKSKNPRTGEPIDIPAKKAAKFKAGSKLVEAIQ